MRKAMKQVVFILFALLLATGDIQAKDKDKPEIDFFVRVVANPQSVIIGDSTLVTYVLYSSSRVSDIKHKDIKVKNASVRQLSNGRRNSMSRVVEDGKIYYTMIGARYMVVPEKIGSITLPSCEFEATFRIRESSGSPFEYFFGYSGPTYEVKSTAKNDPFKIDVTEKPKRKTSEMTNEGLM